VASLAVTVLEIGIFCEEMAFQENRMEKEIRDILNRIA
jgi:hypothetical protein